MTVAVVLAAALAACGGTGAGGGKSTDSGSGKAAAEPAPAPSASADLAATTTVLGAQAEGIVYDATTGLIAVAVRNPDRLLLVDPTTNAVRTSINLPGHARHLQLAAPGGPVLVPVEDANVLVRVALPDGSITTTKVGTQPHDAAGVDDGQLVVGDEFSKQISIVGADGKVERTVTDLVQPGGIVGMGKTVAVVDVGAYTLSTYDVATGARTARVPAGKGPTHGILTTDRRIAVADTRGNAILLYSLDPLQQIGSYPLAGTPYGMAYDAQTNTLWITLTGLNQVVGLNLAGPAPTEIARYATVQQPNTVAVAPGSRTVWVAGTRDGVLQTISR
jgi:hypothetical protein